MPEYVPRADAGLLGLDSFTQAYLECAEWSGIDDGEREAFESSVSPGWSDVSIRRAEQTCSDFRAIAGDLLDEIDDAQAGHDLWLTRNRHGCGFWDRGLGKVGDTLTELAHPYGEAHVFFDAETETLELSD